MSSTCCLLFLASLVCVTSAGVDFNCGYSKVDEDVLQNLDQNLVGGQPEKFSNFGQYPWTIALIDDKELVRCAAALIHPAFAFTLSMCVTGRLGLQQARAGEYVVRSTQEPIPHQQRKIVEVIAVPESFINGQASSPALISFDRPFDLTDNVNPICLPPAGVDSDSFTTHYCRGSGWGLMKDAPFNRKPPTVMKSVPLDIVPRDKCQRMLSKHQVGEKTLCAGGDGNDMCMGDSGAPLSCAASSHHDKSVLVGLVWWGIGCFTSTPGAYVNVAHFRSWIDKQLADKGITLD